MNLVRKLKTFSRVLRRASTTYGGWELCVSGRARFKEDESTLCVTLNCFIRPQRGSGMGTGFSVPWLPPEQTVTRKLKPSRATPMAEMIFEKWCEMVSRSVGRPAHG